jgi:glycosyltransferase involved in cell wall biosynthesis
MLVRAQQSSDSNVIKAGGLFTKLGPPLNSIPLKSYLERPDGFFSPQWFWDSLKSEVAKINPDVIHLHWVCNGFLQIETIAKFHKPVVWTLHDMWPFTGGCHYAEECTAYEKQCGKCPQLASQKARDLSYKIWKRKQKAWKCLNLTVVSPSQWLADCAQSSSLFSQFPIQVIPHGLDLETYKPIEKATARAILGLPQNKHLILFGASNGITEPRKGFHLLQAALKHLSVQGQSKDLELVIFGASSLPKDISLSFPVHFLGKLHDDISIALTYSAANAMVVPSLQEAFGQTASEAIACGTPVVAFKATGLQDVIIHQKSGYLAQAFDPLDMAQGIQWLLENEERYQYLSTQARHIAEQQFSATLQAERYYKLYQNLSLANSGPWSWL